MELEYHLNEILRTLEDETTYDVDKWRKLCFKQMTRINESEFIHVQTISEFNSKIAQLKQELNEIKASLQKHIEENQQFETIIQNLKKQENRLNLDFSNAKNEFEKETSIKHLLQYAPIFFQEQYQAYQIKYKKFTLQMKNIDSLLTKLNKRIETLNDKIRNLIKKFQRNEFNYKQNLIQRERLEKEIEFIQNSIDDKQLPQFSKEISVLQNKFENSTEAALRLHAIDSAIETIQEKMKSVKLDPRVSDCSTLEELIKTEKINQEKYLQNLIEQYNTNELDNEISQIRSRITEKETELNTLKEKSEIEIKNIQKTFEIESNELKTKINANEQTISILQEQINTLKQQRFVNLQHETLKNVETQTIFVVPSFF